MYGEFFFNVILYFAAHIAFCGDTFDMAFNLPFIDYLPPTVPVKFFIRVSFENHLEIIQF